MAISVQQITKSLGDPPTPVLKGISLEIADGEFIAITGKSGSGKSTLLYAISTLDNPTAGAVLYDGQRPEKMSVEDLHLFRNQNIGFVFQFHYLLPELNVIDNVLMPARKTGSQEMRRKEAMDLLESFQLGDKAARLPGQLSGGEQQRVAIARSLIMKPKYIFADEPTGNLDIANGEVVMNSLKKINRDRGATIILVTHDPDYAAMASRQVHLVDGMLG